MTKLQKKIKAAKKAADRRVATALAKYLRQSNPGRKVIGAKVYKQKGGSRRIVPIFDNPSVRRSKKALKRSISHTLGSKRGLRGLGGDKDYWMTRSAHEKRRR